MAKYVMYINPISKDTGFIWKLPVLKPSYVEIKFYYGN